MGRKKKINYKNRIKNILIVILVIIVLTMTDGFTPILDALKEIIGTLIYIGILFLIAAIIYYLVMKTKTNNHEQKS